MPIALRWSLISVLSLLGLAGLAQVPLAPPLFSRTGNHTDQVLAHLESQEANQEMEARAAEVLSGFVGAELTRYIWGGFSGHLDGLGVELPEGLEPRLSQEPGMVQLILVPRGDTVRYVARVEAFENVAKGVACRGSGDPGRFGFQGGKLRCPSGWQELALDGTGA
jgi:hypothetical protein